MSPVAFLRTIYYLFDRFQCWVFLLCAGTWDPEQPRSRSSSKGEAPTSPLRRSRVSSESSSVVSEFNFGFEENVFTEDDIRRFENDYRMPKRNKDEIVEFKFGTLDRKAQLPMKKEEPKKQEQAPVTSLRSLRQAYTRQRYSSNISEHF